MNRHSLVVGIALVSFLSAPAARADVGVHLKGGTLGAGVELTKSFGERFSLGLGFNAYDYKTTGEASDIDYDFKLELQSIALLAHFHPFRGSFRLSAGALHNKNELNLTGRPSSDATYDFDGTTYTAEDVGTLTGVLTFGKTSPYVGIGWGNRPGSRLGVSFDIGALYQGSPKLALNATGALGNPALASDLEQERRSAEEDLDKYEWYPVVSLGVYFRF